jgi:Flp pilus assembly pilin Flp
VLVACERRLLAINLKMTQDAFRTLRLENGQNVVEYGLLIASIVVVVLIGITSFGHLIQPWFVSLANRLTTVGT